jgi:hypothetical protein
VSTKSIRIYTQAKWPVVPQRLIAPVLVLSALALWWITLSATDIRSINDFGLVTVLPIGYFVALGMLTISFVACVVDRSTPHWLLLLHTVVYALIIHGTPAFLYDLPRYAWTFKHVGVSEYFQRYGVVDPRIDIYFNWPGFFALSALGSEIAGFNSPMAIAHWAPIGFNLLNIGALYLIFQALTSDKRHVWFAIWLFSITNWVGQDYFSPQALAYFLFLLMLGICLTWFHVSFIPTDAQVTRWFGWTRLAPLLRRLIALPETTPRPEPNERIPYTGLSALIIGFFITIVVSHQLTPMMAIASITGIVVVRRCRMRSLPLLMTVLTIGWVIYGASTYSEQALAGVIASLGRIFENTRENVTDLSSSTAGRTFVAMSCRVLTISLWGLALLGAVRRFRRGYCDLTATVLAIAPFLILPFQAYGGEMLFRVYYFSLPLMAWFAAALFFPTPGAQTRWVTTLLATVLCSWLLCGMLFAYYGNERMNHFSQEELAAAEYLYMHAPEGARVLAADLNTPIRYRDYEKLFLTSLTDEGYTPETLGTPHVEDVAILMDGGDQRAAYFFITRSQKEYIELFSLMPSGWLDQLEADLVRVPGFELIYSNRDAKVFQLHRDALRVAQ